MPEGVLGLITENLWDQGLNSCRRALLTLDTRRIFSRPGRQLTGRCHERLVG
jgi:hypothetical protein